jgi:hypothetical protein
VERLVVYTYRLDKGPGHNSKKNFSIKARPD